MSLQLLSVLRRAGIFHATEVRAELHKIFLEPRTMWS